jgi:hypothetical protein
MLRNAHRPQDAYGLRVRYFLGDTLKHIDGDAGALRREIECVGLQGLLVFLEFIHPALDERLLVPTLVENVFGDGVDPYGVRRWLGLNEDVGARCHLMLSEIGDDNSLAEQFMGTLDARGEDRMTLAGIRADDDDE